MVKQIKNKTELEQFLAEAGDKLIVLDFFATWCGPCKMIAPKLEAIAEELKEKLAVAKVDIDEADEKLVSEYNIEVMPTFVVSRQGKHIETLKGANEVKLRELITKHSS